MESPALTKAKDLTDIDTWFDFKARVAAQNPEFFAALAEKHPKLSPRETKFCALILMECETKECATLLQMEPRTVRAMKLHLKEEFKLPEHMTLHAHLVALR
jgi:AraC family chitin signaling transcriptional activator